MATGIINRIRTALSTARRVNELHEVVVSHDDHLVAALKRIAAVEEKVQEVAAAHVKLRNRMYGEGLHKVASVPQSREERKREALQAAGFTPGRPLNLKE